MRNGKYEMRNMKARMGKARFILHSPEIRVCPDAVDGRHGTVKHGGGWTRTAKWPGKWGIHLLLHLDLHLGSHLLGYA